MPDHTTVLGERVKARRELLGFTRTDLVRHGGPYSKTVRAVEEGATRLHRRTLQDLDTALRWPDGTALALLREDVPGPARVTR